MYDLHDLHEDLAQRVVLRRNQFPTLIRVIDEAQRMLTDNPDITIDW